MHRFVDGFTHCRRVQHQYKPSREDWPSSYNKDHARLLIVQSMFGGSPERANGKFSIWSLTYLFALQAGIPCSAAHFGVACSQICRLLLDGLIWFYCSVLWEFSSINRYCLECVEDFFSSAQLTREYSSSLRFSEVGGGSVFQFCQFTIRQMR